MRVAVKGVEIPRHSAECPRIGGDVPERLCESPVAKVAAKQQEVVADWHPLLAPLGDQPGGEGVSEVMNPRLGAVAGRNEICRECTKHSVNRPLGQGTPAAAQEEAIGLGEMPVALHEVPAQGCHGRRV